MEIGLNAAIVAVTDNEPVVLIIRSEADSAGATDGLPFGPFSPLQHRTFEGGLRAWVHRQTGLELGYAEQLYTFGDRGRHAQPGDVGPHVVSIGYLALTQAKPPLEMQHGAWRSWYHYFPWEDWRRGRPEILESTIEPRLREWVASQRGATPLPISRQERVRICFGLDGAAWDEEKVLDRYELLYEAGLVDEAARDGREAARQWSERPRLGVPMRYDHRRILATAIGRVRAKIKYRPVIFELMPDDFTLFELQRTVEAILGPHLHKQNFRRLVEGAGLVETTGEVKMRTGGRPAKLYRFRREVLLERPAPGVRVKPGKA
ncbi:MAG: NAD regulator [Hyphomicrobium sp.]|nr:MAG: NAD regulator [Hyphomicrobium sp.]